MTDNSDTIKVEYELTKDGVQGLAKHVYRDSPECRKSGCDHEAVAIVFMHLNRDMLTVRCDKHAPRAKCMYGSAVAAYPGKEFDVSEPTDDYERKLQATIADGGANDIRTPIWVDNGQGRHQEVVFSGDSTADDGGDDHETATPTAEGDIDTGDYDLTTTEGLQRLVRDVYDFTPECRYDSDCSGDAVAICGEKREGRDLLFVACDDHAERVADDPNALSVAPVRGSGFDPTFGPEQLTDSLGVGVYE